MTVVADSSLDLLKSLFSAPELHRLLQRQSWGANLVGQLAPPEHQAPDAWLHDLLLAVDRHGVRSQLRALLLREREGRAEEIRAAFSDTPPARVAQIPQHYERAPTQAKVESRPAPIPWC